jgi:uncharacterized membrane protein
MIVHWYSALIEWLWGAICHQIPDRCFAVQHTALGKISLPLCARCTGIWFGSFAAFCYAVLKSRRRELEHPPIKMVVFLYICAVPMFADGLLSYAGCHATTNLIRYATGIPFGVLMSALALPTWHEYGVQDDAHIRQNPPEPLLANYREAMGVYGVSAATGLILLNLNAGATAIPALSAVGMISVFASVSRPLARLVIRLSARVRGFKSVTATCEHVIAVGIAVMEMVLLRAVVSLRLRIR